ncbi:MAG: hypothetical protein GY943_30850 [Chloroflexi bacterium]|nr:hypothetical protein [Chloroflexota bacterium]
MSEFQHIEFQSHKKQDDKVLEWMIDYHCDLPTPLYLYSESELNQAVTSYRTLFPENARGFYALKANPQPALVKYFSTLGIGAEITGDCEWALSNLADVHPSNTLVGGVSKSEAFLETVCSKEPAAIVIESETEWQRLQRVTAVSDSLSTAVSHQAKILLRINPGVSFGGLNMAGGSQFGLSTEQALTIARECATIPQIEFLGLHFYFGSQRLEVSPIIQAIEVVEETIQAFQEAGISIRVVDLGLGCGVPYLARDKSLDMLTLREQLQQRWQTHIWNNIEVWFEAGRALVASSGYFIARVIDRKQLHGETFIFLNGGLNVHNPGVGLGMFFRRNPRFQFITANATEAEETVNIVGNLCTTADTLGTKVTAPKLQEGDLVLIPNAGAYCQTTAMWGFNSQPLFQEGMLSHDGLFTLIKPQYQLSIK